MGWDPATVPDPQDPQTFANSKLDWSEPYPESGDAGQHGRLLGLYRDLLALRRARPELTDPRFSEISIDFDADARWLVLGRGDLVVAVNLGDQTLDLELDGKLLLSTGTGVTLDEHLSLPPRTAAILDTVAG